jgi:hypothetical protein
MLIAATSAVLGHRSDAYVWLLERARMRWEVSNKTLYILTSARKELTA